MNRTGLAIALGIAAATGVVFALYPQLDLAIARLFYVAETRFPLSANASLALARDAAMIVVACFAAPAVIAIVVKIVRPQRPMLISDRAAAFLVSTLLLGPLLAVNIGLKDHWSRPRPQHVTEFGGTEKFVPWWDPRGSCRENCSFVAGEAAGAAWTLAPAALAPPHWRVLAYAGALSFTAAVGALRMAFGGHYFTDVVFACVLMFLLVWLAHGALYRWPRTRPRDGAIESALAQLGEALRVPFRGQKKI